jgi:hypothetical protein
VSRDEQEVLTVRLTLAEAMTVLAAVRQYEPYWSPRDSAEVIAEQLRTLRLEIESVIAKVRVAAECA